jgi:2'-5' RNA ligase/GNAT superfamily N-acetyltransferase
VSPRRRLGVALLLDPPVSLEADGLRRALGDSALGHVGPHLTLVPPVNVRTGDLSDALAVVRRAAARLDEPLWLELGPVATFVPASPVLYLAVGGTDLGPLERLRAGVLSGPLLRPGRWPWVPHVTLTDQASAEEAAAALTALRHYRSPARFDRVVLLEERGRRWHPLADSCFGPPAVVGRGGLELEITEGRMLGPDVLAMAESQHADFDDVGDQSGMGAILAALRESPAIESPAIESIVLTGRRQGQVTGVAAAWQAGQVGEAVNVSVLVEAGSRRQGVGRALVTALELSVARRGWATDGVRGYGPEQFFRNASPWVREFRSFGG